MGEKAALFRRHSPRYVTLDEDNVSELSWSSRPNTQDGIASVSSCSRLSSDSGASSIEDFNRRGSSPLPTTFLDYWDGVRRHTAPPRKTPMTQSVDYGRPNTVHAWDVYPSRSTLSRYTPLPAIGTKPDDDGDSGERQRKYCFQEVGQDETAQCDDDEEEGRQSPHVDKSDCEEAVFRRPDHLNVPKLSCRLGSLSLESDEDSDFDEESESGVVCPTDDEDDDDLESQRKRRPIVRSATFTIEDKKRESEEKPEEAQVSTRLLLAVRLPDGSRVAGYFDSKDSLREVFALAQDKLSNPLGHFELVTTEIPKRTFSDFSLTLDDVRIADKTLLNLQSCEDEDSE